MTKPSGGSPFPYSAHDRRYTQADNAGATMTCPWPPQLKLPTAHSPSALTRITHPTRTRISAAQVRTAPGPLVVRLLAPLLPASARTRLMAVIPRPATAVPRPGHTAIHGPVRASSSAKNSPMSAVGTCSVRRMVTEAADIRAEMRRLEVDDGGRICADRVIWKAETRARPLVSLRW